MTRFFVRFFSYLICVSLTIPAGAETLVIRAPSASPAEYEAYLNASSERISPIQFYLRAHPTSEMRRLLLQRFASAQQSFLSGSLEAARSGYASVVQMTTEDDWGPREREAFFLSYLRLAQLTEAPSERDEWLQASFTVGEEFKPESRLFPPPLLARWQELRAAQKRLVVPTVSLTNFDMMLINGSSYSLLGRAEIALRPGRYRVTYLSSHQAPVTRILTPEEMAQPPTSTNLVEGNCSAWALNGPWPSARAFFAIDCENRTEPRMSSSKPPTGAPTSAPTSATTSSLSKGKRGLLVAFQENRDRLAEPPPPAAQAQTSWLKRPLFWGITGATLAVLLVAQSQSRDGRTTTAGHGFN